MRVPLFQRFPHTSATMDYGGNWGDHSAKKQKDLRLNPLYGTLWKRWMVST